MVSDVFEGKSLDQQYVLTKGDKGKRTWTKLFCESSGLANLARVHGLEGEKNTVFARVVLVSEREQIRRIRFGFSDRAKVYFGDRAIYGGSDVYRSRDYRFLGTVGLFDELYLPLNRGENEIWIAVTENFGGWGILAVVDDMQGIEVKE
jgi:hypothetical protein